MTPVTTTVSEATLNSGHYTSGLAKYMHNCILNQHPEEKDLILKNVRLEFNQTQATMSYRISGEHDKHILNISNPSVITKLLRLYMLDGGSFNFNVDIPDTEIHHVMNNLKCGMHGK